MGKEKSGNKGGAGMPGSATGAAAEAPPPPLGTADKFLRLGLIPIAAYFLAFCALTYPTILHFNTRLFADTGDGLQNLWNLWWVNKAVTELHQSPWHTTYLHYPHGATLLAHTLNPFNGFAAIVLLRFMSLPQAFNTMVVFSFVAGGLTAFWLSWHLVRAWWPSLIAGGVFTFSAFHFAHAIGQMQLVSLEWMPLFLLLWWRLVREPTVWRGAAAAGALLLVILCDYYYFFYCVLAGAVILGGWMIRQRRLLLPFDREHRTPLIVFAAGTLATAGPLVFSLLWMTHHEQLLLIHDPYGTQESMDLLTPFVYGGHWRFGSLTAPLWLTIDPTVHTEETSVYLGLSVIFLLVYAACRRRSLRLEGLGLWFFILGFFAIMALGPALHVAGRRLPVPMPYRLLQWMVPGLSVSGMPVRMIVMTVLASSVIVAAALRDLFSRSWGWRVAAGLVLALMVFEHLPAPMTDLELKAPAYVAALRDLPGNEGVFDLSDTSGITPFISQCQHLYFQTVHQKPMTYGYISRLYESLIKKDAQMIDMLRQGRFHELHANYGIRWVVLPAEYFRAAPLNRLPVVFRDYDSGLAIGDLDDASRGPKR